MVCSHHHPAITACPMCPLQTATLRFAASTTGARRLFPKPWEHDRDEAGYTGMAEMQRGGAVLTADLSTCRIREVKGARCG